MRVIDVRLHDTTLGIWQDNANDPTFKAEIFDGLIREMRGRGWTVGRDDEVHKRHRCISPNYRMARCGDLRASLQICGRHIELTIWAETWPIDNSNGQRYDFDKRERMLYLDRLRVDLEFQRIIRWLEGRATVTVKDRAQADARPALGKLTAMDWIARRYAECAHSDKDLGRPVCRYRYNDTARDGGQILHGEKVWFVGRDYRIRTGIAFYALNSNWYVVSSTYVLHHASSHEMFTICPPDLRRKRNERRRRERLEALLGAAIRAMAFERAAHLRDILFAGAPTYLIWARDHHAYYRSNYSGYTTDAISAGRYTREEAERECRRVPHELSMVMPNGSHVRFDREAA